MKPVPFKSLPTLDATERRRCLLRDLGDRVACALIAASAIAALLLVAGYVGSMPSLQ
jgi:hypothetical protein